MNTLILEVKHLFSFQSRSMLKVYGLYVLITMFTKASLWFIFEPFHRINNFTFYYNKN
jgi:hypothetical protein